MRRDCWQPSNDHRHHAIILKQRPCSIPHAPTHDPWRLTLNGTHAVVM
jgi:hypothetical protein